MDQNDVCTLECIKNKLIIETEINATYFLLYPTP